MFMTRYQIYLDSASVSIIDETQEFTGISRSKIIRDLVDRYAHNMLKIFSVTHTPKLKESMLEGLVGIVDSGKKTTNYAMDSDIKYLKD